MKLQLTLLILLTLSISSCHRAHRGHHAVIHPIDKVVIVHGHRILSAHHRQSHCHNNHGNLKRCHRH